MEKGGRQPQIPNTTRWNSQLECLITYITNWTLYNEIVRENPILFSSDMTTKIKNASYYYSAIDLRDQLKVVGDALNHMQSDQISFSRKLFIHLLLVYVVIYNCNLII